MVKKLNALKRVQFFICAEFGHYGTKACTVTTGRESEKPTNCSQEEALKIGGQ